MIDWGSYWAGVGTACAVIFLISALIFGILAKRAPVADEHEKGLRQ